MPVNFNDFTAGANVNLNDQIVGFNNTSVGGERKWRVATLSAVFTTNSYFSSVSALWDSTWTTTKNTSTYWSSVYTSVRDTSAYWNSVYTSVRDTSAYWNSVYTSVRDTSANWNSVYTSVRDTSAYWQSVYTSVRDTSANWNSTHTTVKDNSANWSSVYSTVCAASANWSSGYTTASAISATLIVPTGAVMPFATETTPRGWLSADGSIIPPSGFHQGVDAALLQTLRNMLGSTYGSTGQLPDLRGYFIRGFGTNTDGTASGAFGQKQADDFKSHDHAYTDRYLGGTGSNSYTGAGTQSGGFAEGKTTSTQGGTETRPKNIALLYCIKY